MSVERVSNNFEHTRDYSQVNTDKENNELIFDYNEYNVSDVEISTDENTGIYQNNLNKSAGLADTSQEQMEQALTVYLDNIVTVYEDQFEKVRENNGIIAKGWDWFKNKTGIGAGSDKIQAQITELKSQIEELKKDPTKLEEVYKSVTGKELNDEEINNLINGKADLSESEIVGSVTKYTQGQKQCTNIISGITSSLAVVGLVAAGVVTAPFTGGMSLAATAGALGALTAAGTAAYMVPQVIDGVTEKDGYSFKEVMQDAANGVINSAFTSIGIGGGKVVGNTIGKVATTQAGKKAAAFAASETTSLIIGDGIGIGNYLTETAFNEDVDFSWTDLGKTAAVSTTSSLAAGAAAFGTSSVVRPVLTSGTTATNQIAGRLLSAGITGGSAGMSAAAIGGGTNYLLTCAIDGREVSFEEWLNATAENMDSAMLTGFIGGMAFEAVHLAAGTPKPEGAVKSVNGTNEDGLKFTNYLDKNGNVIATDISASDAAKIYGSSVKGEEGLIQYDSTASTEGKVYDTTRTFRISYTNIPDVEVITTQDGSEVFTQAQGENYRADLTIHDWADNAYYLGSGVVKGSNIPKTQENIVNAESEVMYDEVQTPEFNGNGINTPQLTQGKLISQENGLVPFQSENPNSENVELIVDTTIAQLTAQQAQMVNLQSQAAGVEAQAEGGIISASAVNAGISSNIAGVNNVPPVQVIPPQNYAVSNISVQTQVTDESGIESTNPALTQETTEPQLPTPEEIEKRTEFLKEKYPNMFDIFIKFIAESNNIQYENAMKLGTVAEQKGVMYIDQYLASFASSEETTEYALECIDAGMIDFTDISVLVFSTDIPRTTAIELIKNGITNPNNISTICSLPKEQYETAVELVKAGITENNYIKNICSLPQEQHETAIKLINAKITDSYFIEKICSLPQEQRSTAIELVKAGITSTYAINEICSLPQEQQSIAVELVKAGITSTYAIREIYSLPKEQQSTAIELVKAGMTNTYTISQICSFPQDQHSTAIELVKAGMTSSFEIEDICSLPKDQQANAIELVKAGLQDSFNISELSSLDQDQLAIAIELIHAGITSSDDINEICLMLEGKQLNIRENFIFKDDYGSKIQKAAQGKYQEQLTNVFKSSRARKDLFKSGLSEQDIMLGIKKLAKSTFKFAMNTPNQYLSNIDIKYTTKVDGKYPQLSEEELLQEQSQIIQFFEYHAAEMVRALKYVDVDTLNQMMDRRTDLFAETLLKMNNLTDENYEILSKLIRCKSTDRDGKVLTAREKIQLSQIVEIFQQGKINTDILSEIAETGSVSLAQLKKQIQTEVLKKAGLNDTDIASLSESKLKFNEEYSYLTLLNGQEAGVIDNDFRVITRQMIKQLRQSSDTEIEKTISTLEKELSQFSSINNNYNTQLFELSDKFFNMLKNMSDYTNEEIVDVYIEMYKICLEISSNSSELFTVIRESTLGDFKTFITDETNKYGLTNAKTKEAFTSKGLDYEQWLNPDVEDVQIGLRDREYTIKLWDRNPQEDLFMGNKTSCCTAIGVGGNAGATPVYLLNTSYNVVELYDDNGVVIGMSRVFMGEVEGKPALIMDNIELNSQYKDSKATDEEKITIRNGFFEYMKKYAQAVTGEKTPVYFYSSDIHVPNSDLEHKYAVTGFIGNISQEKVYVNSAGCSWINPQNLPDCGEIDWLVVP